MTTGTSPEIQALAIVAASLRRKARPYDLLTISRAVNLLIGRYGLQEAAKRADVSPGMLRQFAVLTSLPPDVQDLLASRELDHVSAASFLARLKRDTDKSILARLLVTKNLTREEIQDIVQYANRNESKTLEECVAEVLSSRATKKRIYLIVMSAPSEGLGQSAAADLRRLGARQVHVQGSHVIIITDEAGKRELARAAKSADVPLSSLASELGASTRGHE